MTEQWQKARKRPVDIYFRKPIPNTHEAVTKPAERIETREGILYAYPGIDYVIRGVEGELYPIKKEIFAKTYDIINDDKLDDFDKELLNKIIGHPEGVEQCAITWDYEDLEDSFINYRLKCLARDGYIKRESKHNHVTYYPVNA